MFKTHKITLPKGQEGFNLYVISDVYINSEEKRKVNLAKLKKDMEIIAQDPKAKVIINGNLFYFDAYIFGFDNTKTMLEKVKMDYITRQRVRSELVDIKNTEDEEEKLNLFDGLSEEAKLQFTKELFKQMDTKDLHSLTPYTSEAFKILQTKVFEPYIQEYVKLFEPIKDKIVVYNSGNEEEKVNNYRQYSPMQQLAEAMEQGDKYIDDRFYVLLVKENSRLTDYKDKETSIIGTYGILSGNTYSAVESKMRNIFKNFSSFDFQITSGYKKFMYIKESRFFTDEHNNLILKPQYLVSFAGYDKVSEPNKVRMASYRAENELSNTYLAIATVKNAQYVSKKLVDMDGVLAPAGTDNIRKYTPVDVDLKTKKYLTKLPYYPKYKPVFDTFEYGTTNTLVQESDKSRSDLLYNTMLDMIKHRIDNAPSLFQKAIENSTKLDIIEAEFEGSDEAEDEEEFEKEAVK